MDNKDNSKEVLHLVGLSAHCNMMHGTYNVKNGKENRHQGTGFIVLHKLGQPCLWLLGLRGQPKLCSRCSNRDADWTNHGYILGTHKILVS